jgi:hypothetical protein
MTLIIAGLLSQSGCVKEYGNQPLPNQPPKTYFWIFPDSTISTGISKQHLRWWGEDLDGYVVGYLVAFGAGISHVPALDTLTYGFTTATDSIVQFPLRQASAEMLMVIRAVDNSFGTSLPRGATVRLSPEPFWDVNNNGVFDAGDVSLKGISSALDQNGASQIFPIKNSPPIISYVKDLADPTKWVLPPDTTFTVVSFRWEGSDPDGDETIASYQIALNDTTDPNRWLTVRPNVTMVTLMVPRSRSDVSTTEVTADVYNGVYPAMVNVGQLAGLRLNAGNKLYVRAVDVAGGVSSILPQPEAAKKWFVKKPVSRLLVISDYSSGDLTIDNGVKRFYRNIFSNVASGQIANFDLLDIRVGGPAAGPGILVPNITVLNPMFVYTLKLFDYVFWYTDKTPSLTIAQYSLFYYSALGGKVIFATEFANANDPGGALRDFAPIDSICSVTLPGPLGQSWLGVTSIPKSYLAHPDSSNVSDLYPVLAVDSLTVTGSISNLRAVFVRPIYKRADARYIYHLQKDTRSGPYVTPYVGNPNIAVVRNDKRFVFIGFPLHFLNGSSYGGQGVASFFDKVFVQEFGL